MADKSLYNIVSEVNLTNNNPAKVLTILQDILESYEEDELKVTPWTRCEIIITCFNSTGLSFTQDDLDYMTQSILFNKGQKDSLLWYGNYSGSKVTFDDTEGYTKVIFDDLPVSDEYIYKIDELLYKLVNELIFHSTPDGTSGIVIKTIITNLTANAEITDLTLSNQETIVINCNAIND